MTNISNGSTIFQICIYDFTHQINFSITYQTRDISSEIEASSRHGRQSDICVNFHNLVKSLPQPVYDAFTAISLTPDFIVVYIFDKVRLKKI